MQRWLDVLEKMGPLAQLVEQLTFNQLVEGSNPSRPTTNNFNDLANILLDMKPHL